MIPSTLFLNTIQTIYYKILCIFRHASIFAKTSSLTLALVNVNTLSTTEFQRYLSSQNAMKQIEILLNYNLARRDFSCIEGRIEKYNS